MSRDVFREHSCACCGGAPHGAISRRGIVGAALAIGAAAMLSPRSSFAAAGNYDAMVLSCIDPRLQNPVRDYIHGRGLSGKYSQFVVAGAAIGAVAEPFKDWHKTFWDNLATSIRLHGIGAVIAIDHRDCGAARIAYGADSVATPEREAETHRSALRLFRRQVGERHPKLSVETALMALDGSIELFT